MKVAALGCTIAVSARVARSSQDNCHGQIGKLGVTVCQLLEHRGDGDLKRALVAIVGKGFE